MKTAFQIAIIEWTVSMGNIYAQTILGDNLGSHIATKNLDINNFDLINSRLVSARSAVIGSTNTTLPDNVALKIEGSNGTILIPRVTDLLNSTTPSIPTANVLNGMIVYNNKDNQFYFRQNGTWVSFASDNLSAGKIYIGNSLGQSSQVSMTGDMALDSIGTGKINDGVIQTVKILNNSVSGAKVKSKSLIAQNFKNQSITNTKLAPSSINDTKILGAAPGTVLSTGTDGNVKWSSYSALGFIVGDIKPYFSALGLPIPTGWVECNGQLINDSESPLNGKTLPNLNNSTYLVGGSLSVNNTSVGQNLQVIAMSNLPTTSATGSTSLVSAGSTSGRVTVSTGGSHTHNFMDSYFSTFQDKWSSGGAASGDYMGISSVRAKESSAASAINHSHSATFSGNTLPNHTHNGTFILNDVQTPIAIRPQSIVTTWIIRIK